MFNAEKYINLGEMDVRMLNPLVWAYIGDAVYEVYVRSFIISNTKKNSHDLHVESIKFVKAGAQSEILEELMPYLTEEEQNVVRRGRNTRTGHVPKNADVIDYRRATALEGLIGYLYLMKRFERIDEIMNIVFERTTS
ncbi:Mini-ribonuclease 3 [Fonticella tunisiensis]|nr:ribonuclease III domain-containing protein [Fonticella tunisiensis]